jgi:hypothetical protein
VEAEDFPTPKNLGLKNLLAHSWQVFSGMRKTYAFRIHTTEDYHNWTDLW